MEGLEGLGPRSRLAERGVEPPASLWLGAPNDAQIVREAKGNALVRYVGGRPVTTSDHRLPEVAVGENQYVPVAPAYDDATFLGDSSG